jgi:NADH-quinone oxidoreductase subunit N
MNSPILFIGIPLLAGLVLWFFRTYRVVSALSAAGLSLIMMILALVIRIDSLITLGTWTFEISPTFFVLGRKFVILDTDRAFLVFIFLFGVFWYFGAALTDSSRYFVPLGLGIMALLIATLAVEPFLYAALFMEIAALLSIPMLSPPGMVVGQGVKRFIIYQTLAVPFILFAGWVAGGVEANPADELLLSQAVILLGMGFAFWMAVFPFYTWVPFLSSEAQPYVSGYMLGLLPMIVLLLALDFLNAFVWLRDFAPLMPVLRVTGLIMVVTAGVLSAFQQNLGRLFGYAVIFDNGFSLLALSLGYRVGYEILLMSFLPRMVGLGVFALSLTVLTKERLTLSFDRLRDQLPRYPLACGAVMAAYFSLGGLPLLASFPVRMALIGELAGQSISGIAWLIAGMFGYLLGGFRTLSVLAGGKRSAWSIGEGTPQAFILAGGVVMLLLLGLFPNLFLPRMIGLLEAFTNLL